MHVNRVKVTLNEDASAAIRRLSKASGESMSGVISSLFEPNVSTLNDMADLFEHANSIRQRMPEESRLFFRLVMNTAKSHEDRVNDLQAVVKSRSQRDTPKEAFQKETARLNALREPKNAQTEQARNDAMQDMCNDVPAIQGASEPWAGFYD